MQNLRRYKILVISSERPDRVLLKILLMLCGMLSNTVHQNPLTELHVNSEHWSINFFLPQWRKVYTKSQKASFVCIQCADCLSFAVEWLPTLHDFCNLKHIDNNKNYLQHVHVWPGHDGSFCCTSVGQMSTMVNYPQDGAHWGLSVWKFLNDTFLNRWIVQDRPTPWLPRSPDMTPRFFLLGVMSKRKYIQHQCLILQHWEKK